jgi:hypothetical protein
MKAEGGSVIAAEFSDDSESKHLHLEYLKGLKLEISLLRAETKKVFQLK